MFPFAHSSPFAAPTYGRRQFSPPHNRYSDDAYFAALSQEYERASRARQLKAHVEAERRRAIERQREVQEEEEQLQEAIRHLATLQRQQHYLSASPFDDDGAHFYNAQHDYQRQRDEERAQILRDALKYREAQEAREREQQQALLLEHEQRRRNAEAIRLAAQRREQEQEEAYARALQHAMVVEREQEQRHQAALLERQRAQEALHHQQERLDSSKQAPKHDAQDLMEFLRVFTGRDAVPQTIDQVTPQAEQPKPQALPVERGRQESAPAKPVPQPPATAIPESRDASPARSASLTALVNLRKEFFTILSNFTLPSHLDLDPASTTKPILLYTSNNAPIRAFEQALMTLLAKVDDVQSDGDEAVRRARKELVGRIEAELERLDKWQMEVFMAQKKDVVSTEEKEKEDAAVVTQAGNDTAVTESTESTVPAEESTQPEISNAPQIEDTAEPIVEAVTGSVEPTVPAEESTQPEISNAPQVEDAAEPIVEAVTGFVEPTVPAEVSTQPEISNAPQVEDAAEPNIEAVTGSVESTVAADTTEPTEQSFTIPPQVVDTPEPTPDVVVPEVSTPKVTTPSSSSHPLVTSSTDEGVAALPDLDSSLSASILVESEIPQEPSSSTRDLGDEPISSSIASESTLRDSAQESEAQDVLPSVTEQRPETQMDLPSPSAATSSPALSPTTEPSANAFVNVYPGNSSSSISSASVSLASSPTSVGGSLLDADKTETETELVGEKAGSDFEML